MTNLQLDQVFKALSDPTRRMVLERLTVDPTPVSQLAEPFDMALPSFLQHLDVLEKSGLVRSKKKGRVRMVHLEPKAMKAAEDWMAKQRRVWEKRMDQFDKYVTELSKRGERK